MITKELVFDLDFRADGTIEPTSVAGFRFLETCNLLANPNVIIYRVAIERGLHVSFANADIRNFVTARYHRFISDCTIA